MSGGRGGGGVVASVYDFFPKESKSDFFFEGLKVREKGGLASVSKFVLQRI